MISVSKIILAALCLAASAGSSTAQPRYAAIFSIDGEEINGYARIEANDGKLLGQLCAYRNESTPSAVKPIEPLGSLHLEGNIAAGKMRLKLRPGEAAKLSRLGALRSPRSLGLSPIEAAGDGDSIGSLFSKAAGWSSDSAVNSKIYLELREITSEIRSVESDQYAQIDTGEDQPLKFQLSQFDSMTPQQALSLVVKNKWDEVISPTIVRVVHRSQDSDKVRQFLSQYGNLVNATRLIGPELACGAPYVESIISVPPLLEYYFSRKLQTSGLAARALPDQLPRTPPFIIMSLRAEDLIAPLRAEGSTVDERLSKARTYFETQLTRFLSSSRPKFSGSWEVKFVNSGGDYAYRWQVVGPSISTCTPNRWEKFDVLVAFMMGSGPTVMLNALSGSWAPGSLTQRPSDARFDDNHLSDESLSKIQDSFYGYLITRGVSAQDPDDRGVSSRACKL